MWGSVCRSKSEFCRAFSYFSFSSSSSAAVESSALDLWKLVRGPVKDLYPQNHQ